MQNAVQSIGTFFRIVAPISAPLVVSIIILNFTGTWNFYIGPATFINNRNNYVLSVGIKTVKPAAEVVKTCMDNGVLCLTAKDKVRLLPALNIPQELLEKAVAVIKKACEA